MTPATRETGFTLIEVLVALLVIGIAAAGIIRAVEGHVDAIRGLERRAAAQWVAENRLAELGLVGDAPKDGAQDVEMLGQRWEVQATMRSSDDPDLRQAIVAVRAVGEAVPLVTLRGFVDMHSVTQ